MNFKTTIILIAALMVVGGIALWVGLRGGDGDGGQGGGVAAGTNILDVKSADVSRIVVVAPASGERLVLQRAGDDQWDLVEPIRARAEKFEADRLVEQLAGLKSRGQVEASAAAADLGLDQPRFTVELTDKAGKVRRMTVGAASAVGGNLFVRVEGSERPVVVAADVVETLEKPARSYRQMKLVTTEEPQVRQIEVTKPDGTRLTLVKRGGTSAAAPAAADESEWQIVSPQAMPAETSKVQSLTWALTGLTAKEFVEESSVLPALLPSRNPRLTVWFSTQAPATQPAGAQAGSPTTAPATRPAGGVLVRFGGYDSALKENVFVSVADAASPGAAATLAKVAASTIEAFDKKPLDLRDLRVLRADPSLVSRVSITTHTPAATQPTTRPASETTLLIERKKASTVQGPPLPPPGPAPAPATAPAAAPATQPASTQPGAAVAAATQPAATQPTTHVAATQPASTQPALPSTDWTFAAAGSVRQDASQARVEALLRRFDPLRATRYLEGPGPATQPTIAARHVVEITTEKAGRKTTFALTLTDPGDLKPLVGQHEGLFFEVERDLVEGLTGDFTNKPEEPPPPPMPMPPGGGGFPGGF